ncbi:MAG: SDR family oxidoreductase [Chloroflexi bacterium]|nr:MAG: SDR family oxidoreductase [Chloroflexota bacterium]TMF02165.1 MAG: SDR family oxidoreductase [Chloroflexota bacterium]
MGVAVFAARVERAELRGLRRGRGHPRIRRGREHLVHRGQHRVRVPRFAGARESLSGRLGGKVAIVTGGTAGIGEATVRLFVQEGARVVIVARHASGQGDGSTKFVAGDVVDERTAQAAVAAAEEWGGVDVLVNNAAMDWTSSVLETSAEDVRRVLDTNFLGCLLMQQAAGAKMLERSRGSIVNVTSRTASVGVPTMGLYAAAKGALLALTRTAAIEWARQGVRVNAVAPGLTRTQLVRTWIDGQPDPAAFEKQVVSTIPQGRMAEPEEVASAILFLAGDESKHITGISLAIDGGYTAA